MKSKEPKKFGIFICEQTQSALDPFGLSPYQRSVYLIDYLKAFEFHPSDFLSPSNVIHTKNELKLFMAMLDAQLTQLKTHHDHVKPNGFPAPFYAGVDKIRPK